MAVASYTTNLATVANANTGTDSGTWAELSGHTSGGAATDEITYYMLNGHCVSQSTGVATARTTGLQYDYGSNVSWNTGYVILMWMIYLAPSAIDTWSNSGVSLVVGSSSGNVRFFNALGNDFGRNPYGGWQNIAVDPTYSTGDQTADGSPVAGNYRIFGSNPNLLSAVNKGNPHGVDVIRVGRADIVVTAGSQADGYATFAGMATTNDNTTTARWGLFSYQQGTYLWKGLMTLGTSGTAVNFVDSNRSIAIDSCPRTYATFNRIEINNASSIISWTNISFKALLGPGGAATLTPGDLSVVDNATITMDGCTFQDMNTFTFKSNSTIKNCTFKNCALITSGGGTFTGTKVLTSTVAADASAFGWNQTTDPDGYLDKMTFTKGTNAHHAINFGTSAPTSITLRGIEVSGFSAANGDNDSVLYISRTDADITINVIGCTGTFSYKKAGSNNVTVVVNPITLRVKVQDKNTNPVPAARIGIFKLSDRTELMNELPRDVNITSLVEGTKYIITTVGTGNWTLIGASSATVGVVFTKNSTAGTGTGTASDGVAEQAYSGSATDVEVRIRKASSGATKYKNFSTLGRTGSSDFEILATMDIDLINNATT